MVPISNFREGTIFRTRSRLVTPVTSFGRGLNLPRVGMTEYRLTGIALQAVLDLWSNVVRPFSINACAYTNASFRAVVCAHLHVIIRSKSDRHLKCTGITKDPNHKNFEEVKCSSCFEFLRGKTLRYLFRGKYK